MNDSFLYYSRHLVEILECLKMAQTVSKRRKIIPSFCHSNIRFLTSVFVIIFDRSPHGVNSEMDCPLSRVLSVIPLWRVCRGFYALIASIMAVVPIILMTRFMLYASTCKLISVLTFFNCLVKKWVAPIQALSVPKGCSTV
jgi:hypothetical protein